MNNHFTVIVAGDKPDEIIKKYDSTMKVERYLVYKFLNAEEYRKQELEMYRTALENKDLPEDLIEGVKLKIEELETEDVLTFYTDLTKDLEIDQETGDAYSDENVLGKYDTCHIGGRWALPFIDNDGKEVYTAYKKDIDFSKIHKANTTPYQVAWETVVEGRKPRGSEEERIFENMKNRKAYFSNFKNKQEYIDWNTSLWAYAFVDQKGWTEFSGDIDQQIKWVNNFYDIFIKPLPNNTKLTIFECTRN